MWIYGLVMLHQPGHVCEEMIGTGLYTIAQTWTWVSFVMLPFSVLFIIAAMSTAGTSSSHHQYGGGYSRGYLAIFQHPQETNKLTHSTNVQNV